MKLTQEFFKKTGSIGGKTAWKNRKAMLEIASKGGKNRWKNKSKKVKKSVDIA